MHQLTLPRPAPTVALLVLLAVGAASATPLTAQTSRQGGADSPELGKPGTGSWAYRLSYYHNDDDAAGNPFLDEKLTVIEPAVFFDYNVTARTNIWSKFSFDLVSSASIDRLSKFPAQSGASGDYYFGLDVGAVHQWDATTKVGGFISGSAEYDYRSFGLGGHVAFDLDGHNRTIKTSLSAYFDSLDVIRFNGADAGGDNRRSINAAVHWYQVLNPTLHGEFGLSLTHQSGFLETPYNAVVIENPTDPPNPNLHNLARGTETTEELPDDRFRAALFGRLRWSLSADYALECDARLYGDSWGVSSVTLDPRLYMWLVRERLRASVHCRFYSQTEADYYQRSFLSAPRYRTQDSDLADFSSQTLGVRFDWYLSSGCAFDLGLDYTLRSDDLDFIFATLGFRHDF